ncbi:MAG: hypothetical protein EPO26_00600 [Chloroflexota bacterium]|nr:MAG: hypothetical protein EPO26_00600 [Chloroflexota bacterium]
MLGQRLSHVLDAPECVGGGGQAPVGHRGIVLTAPYTRYVRAVEYRANDDVRIVERDRPTAGAGDIIVALRACGVCGSDVLEWYMKPRAPLIPGHEVVGIVVETDNHASHLRPGTRVFVHHHVPCLVCAACRRGATTSCLLFRSTRLDPGGLAELIRVPREIVATDVLPLPDHLTDVDATLIEPLACCVRTFRRARFRPGDSVLIVGAGLTGQLHAQIARAWGAGDVVIIDPIEERRGLARGLAGARAFALDSEDLANLRCDLVIVTPPRVDVLDRAIDYAAPGGTVVLFGPTGPGETLALEPHRVFFREIAITTTYSADPDDTRTALDLLSRGLVRVAPLVTRVVPFEQAAEAFRVTATHREALKVVVTANGPS